MTLNFTPLSGQNLSGEITAQIREKLDTGVLNSGDKLPSNRALARELKVARGTVVTALETLIAEGFLETSRGSGTYVSMACQPVAKASEVTHHLPERVQTITPDVDAAFSGAFNFQTCRPSLEAFPKMAWRKAAANAASRQPTSDYGDPQGELELRVAIAAYLCRARGLNVTAEEIIVTNGAIQAMHILANLYLTSKSTVAFEDPGYPLARQTFAMTGARILPIAVDEEGLCVDKLPVKGSKLKFVYVTPSHQFPTGRRLSLQRRQELLAWAARHEVLVLEDDYDGEFRYDIAPLPPMAAMNTSGLVVYFGTFSKTMFPGLRVGFAAGDKTLINEMASYRAVTDYQTNTLSQLALANFINGGEFEKHVQRMRRIYSRKRRCLSEAITYNNFPGEISGTDSGINALIRLRTGVSAADISHRALLEGISVTPIARYAQLPAVKDDALVLGYGAVSEAHIEQGIALLANIINGAS